MNGLSQVGDFRVLRRLGSGGFGEVWLGVDERIDRQVAIKVFKPRDENLVAFATSSDEEGLQILRERFLREAKILASLEHEPHVVGIIAFGELDDGAPWYAMPYLPSSLAQRLGRDVFDGRSVQELPTAERPRALPFAEGLPLLGEVLAGLAAAHGAGLVHRDIKPSNVLLTERGSVRLADFGIAKAPDAAHSTVSQFGIGSRNYMAPEQRESAKHVDARADVYAVGVLAYRMVAGRLPQGRFADPQVHAPSLSDALNRWILKCMEQSPADRFDDARAMRAAFAAACATQDHGTGAGQGAGATTATVTVVASERAALRPELLPLRNRIETELRTCGELSDDALQGLYVLGSIADLDAAAVRRFVDEVERELADELKPLRGLLGELQRRAAAGALSPSVRAAMVEAAQAIGRDEAWVVEALERFAQARNAEPAPTEDRTPAPPAQAADSARVAQEHGATPAATVPADEAPPLVVEPETPSTSGESSKVHSESAAQGRRALVAARWLRCGYATPPWLQLSLYLFCGISVAAQLAIIVVWEGFWDPGEETMSWEYYREAEWWVALGTLLAVASFLFRERALFVAGLPGPAAALLLVCSAPLAVWRDWWHLTEGFDFGYDAFVALLPAMGALLAVLMQLPFVLRGAGSSSALRALPRPEDLRLRLVVALALVAALFLFFEAQLAANENTAKAAGDPSLEIPA